MHPLAIAAAVLAALYVVQRWLEYQKLLSSIHNFPGHRTLFSSISILLKSRIPFITAGADSDMTQKYNDYASFGVDVISLVNIFPRPSLSYEIADAEVQKEIINSRGVFVKPVELYDVLAPFGSNILITEGNEWKRQRKIVAPVFSERNNNLIWDATLRVVHDLMDNVWKNQDRVEVAHAVDVTQPLALFVLSAASFGKPISWTQGNTIPAGYTLPFKDAIRIVMENILLKVVAPAWALRWGLTAQLREFQLGWDEFSKYLAEMIQDHKQSHDKGNRADVLASLVAANEEETEKDTKLTDGELEGNTFIFLLAGHETTAHSLAFALGLLALYPDEQEKYYQHLKSYLADGHTPTYEEMPKLEYSLAVFYEALRLFPTTKKYPKMATEDTTLTTTNAAGAKVAFPVPKGTHLVTSVFAMHYNPRYWADPYDFKPQRFLGDYNRDAFVPFSLGARACIGRKFSETEAVAALTTLITRYRVELKEEPQFAGETFREKRERLFALRHAVTLAPKKLPLVFVRRD